VILAGHVRAEAAKLLALKLVPIIVIKGLSPAQKRALLLADNRLTENGGWDRERLSIELPQLQEILSAEGLDIAITGFEPVEIDKLQTDFEDNSADPADELNPDWRGLPPVTVTNDVWQLGKHRMLCGDARDRSAVATLMESNTAAMVFLDPPYNRKIKDIVGRGQIKHSEFAMASGELSRKQFVQFLSESLGLVASVSRDGAIHYVCMDWRHIGELLEAAEMVYGKTLNVVVWVKSNRGQGSFYRSQHEFIGVFCVGTAAHLNNIQLGRHGRSRSNVWHYGGVNTFRVGRLDDLSSHPTVKPVALVADAIKDCTRRDDIVLDTFSGSGTTVLAAERVGRRGFAMEIEPRFVDVAIRRWQTFTRKDAVHVATGLTFDEISLERTRSAKSRERQRPRGKRR
jgi:DNA modification methylase